MYSRSLIKGVEGGLNKRGEDELEIFLEIRGVGNFFRDVGFRENSVLSEAYVVFLNKIRTTACQPFNVWRLKTVALLLSQKLISASAALSCGHQVLKGSRALEGHTYITKTLFPPTKPCVFE